MRPSRLARVAGATLLGLTAFAVAAPLSGPAQAGPATPEAPTAPCPPGQRLEHRVTRGPSGKRVTVPVCVAGGTTPGRPGEDGGGDEGGGSDGGDNDGTYTICTPWSEAHPGHDPSLLVPGEPGEEAYQCVPYSGGRPMLGPYLPTWLGPGEAVLPSPAEVAADVWAEVSADLPDPVVAADPAVGTPALLDVPTFVHVENWLDPYFEYGCDDTGVVCVRLILTPALTFDPGDGTGEIACEPGGTTYDASMGNPRDVAAADGACAHAYPQRTGVPGRPEAWTGEVTVTWTVDWEPDPPSAGGGGGTLDPIPMPATFDREVEEVQSVGRRPGV